MKRAVTYSKRHKRLHGLLEGDQLWRIFPTLSTVLTNRTRVTKPQQIPELPDDRWSVDLRHQLLTFSEERRRNIEGKGPGIATVSAVIVAAALLVVTGGWDESTLVGRVLLVLISIYAIFSLMVPLYLVGPIKRSTLTVDDAQTAASSDDPDTVLADRAVQAAVLNDLENVRLTNLLDAARRELSYTLALTLLWLVAVPITGLLNRGAGSPHLLPAATVTQTITVATQPLIAPRTTPSMTVSTIATPAPTTRTGETKSTPIPSTATTPAAKGGTGETETMP